MLAQNFKSAADLDISEEQKDALIKTLVFLETGKLKHEMVDYERFGSGGSFTGHFNMGVWQSPHECGTIACIGGTAEFLGNVEMPYVDEGRPAALHDLFEPNAICWSEWKNITTAQAAQALRSYLTTGDAKWREAIA